MHRRIVRQVAALALAGALLAGCGGSSSKSVSGSGSWSPTAETAVTNLASQLKTDFTKQCNDFRPFPRVPYEQTYSKLHSPIPLAVGQCTVAGENVEISAFADAKHRDAFVTSRQKNLCAAAQKANQQLPALRWVVADDWSMQPDSQDLGEKLATALHARYEMTPCSAGEADWSDTDIAHVDALARTLQQAGIGCAAPSLENRDSLIEQGHYIQIGVPGAYARCTVGDDTNVQLASFDDTQTQLTDFAPQELSTLCSQSSQTRGVAGKDWVVFVSKSDNAAAIAKALGGKVSAPCH